MKEIPAGSPSANRKIMNNYTEYGYRGLEEVMSARSEIEMLKKQIAEEVKAKYEAYKKIKELQEELQKAKDAATNY